jgi:hypothetical protein
VASTLEGTLRQAECLGRLRDSSRWYDAMKEEMNSMDKNKVWLIRVA